MSHKYKEKKGFQIVFSRREGAKTFVELGVVRQIYILKKKDEGN